MEDSVLTAQKLLLKRKELALERRRRELRRENGLVFYQPHAKQRLFHSMAHKQARYARTGNRFGKSQMGAAEDVAFAMGERMWVDKNDPMRFHGIPTYPTKGLIVTTDWEKSTEIFTSQDSSKPGKLFEYIPRAAIKKVLRNHSGAIGSIVVGRSQGGGESSIHFDTVKSFKQNPLGQESSDWDWAHFDEPVPRPMFVAVARGFVDRAGKYWFTCTPLQEMWINDMFVPSRRTELIEGSYLEIEDRFMMVGSIYDNPYLTEGAIAAFEATLTPDEKACRLQGIPTAMAGLVYKEFDYNLHILQKVPFGWEAFDLPPLDYTIRFAIDPHPKKPHAVLFAATAPHGHTFFYHEIYNPCLIHELCDQIKNRTRDRMPMDSIIDPIANTPDPITGTTMKEEFFKHGVFVEEATKDLSGGILKVRAGLRARNPDGNPNWFFSPDLTRTIYEFDHYVWDGEKDKPEKKNDDMMENLYRLALTDLEYISPTTTLDYRTIAPSSIEDFVGDESYDDMLLADEEYQNSRGIKSRGRLARKRNRSNDVY